MVALCAEGEKEERMSLMVILVVSGTVLIASGHVRKKRKRAERSALAISWLGLKR